MADMHSITFTILINDYDKWSDKELADMRTQYVALMKVQEVISKAAYEYMQKHPSVYPNPELV